MVLSNSAKSNQAAFSECILELESGMKIDYVAPAYAAPLMENSSIENSMSSVLRKEVLWTAVVLATNIYLTPLSRSLLKGFRSDPREEWEGVFEMCYALDHAVRFETDTLVKGCKVLEIGFCTGLPSVFAMKNGAEHITLNSNNNELMESCMKSTFSRNRIKSVQYKILRNSMEEFRNTMKPNEWVLARNNTSQENIAGLCLWFEVIFAVEFFNSEKNRFEEIHDFIDYALTNNGVCLLESRMSYINCESSLQDFWIWSRRKANSMFISVGRHQNQKLFSEE
ncbi:hypothetical protein DINM_002111 [Dirofilaria immitis]|nr:hypothetical protein [Dirofilaria immitis]